MTERASFSIQDNGGELIQYNYTSYSAYIGKGGISSCPDYRFPVHWHDDIEFSVILRGKMQYNINGIIETVHEGEGIFINSRQLHFNYSADRTECEYICILLHPIQLYQNPAFNETYVAPLLTAEHLSYIHLSPQTDWQDRILQQLLTIYQFKDHTNAPLRMHPFFCQIWSELYENMTQEPQTSAHSEDLTIIKEMVNYIQGHYRDRISLKDIAATGSVGQSKCCLLFKRYMNLTPNAYLNQFRLTKSREYLETTDLSITEIAAAVGYNGSSYYTESFRKWYGISPSEYRQTKGKSCPFRTAFFS